MIYQGITLIAAIVVLVVAIRFQFVESVYIAAGALTIFLLIRFVDWFWDAMPRFVFFLVLAGGAFAWLIALRRLRARLEHVPRAPDAYLQSVGKTGS
jgi:hypothetical protein